MKRPPSVHFMIALFAAMALLVIALPACADVLRISWTNATTNTNGSTIPATGPGSLTLTRVEWGSCNADGITFGTVLGQINVDFPGTLIDLDFAPALWCFRAFHRNTYSVESVASVTRTRLVPPPTPGRPGLAVVRPPPP